MLARSIGLVIACLGLLAPDARADEDASYVPPDFMAALPPLPATVDASAVWKLDLSEALRVAVRENLGVSLERESLRQARLGITVAGGPFEPLLQMSYDHGHSDAPPTTIQAGMPGETLTSVNDDWHMNLSQRLDTGTTLAVDFLNNRALSSAGTAVEPLHYLSTLSVTVSQPLLRGFSTDLVVPRVDVLRANIASEREREQLAITASNVVEQTEDAYWDLVQALYSHDLQVRSTKRAEDQLALTKRQIDAGLTPPSDLISAQSTLAQRKLLLVQAEQTIDQASDQLRSILNLPREQWARPILPVDLPSFTPEASSPDAALAIAIKNRPELVQANLDLETAVLGVRQAENNKLPEIDLGLTRALVGEDAGYGGALNNVARADNHAYQVVVNFTWTPLRRATTAAAAIQRSQQRMAKVRREQQVQSIWLAVRDAVRNQSGAARQVAAAATSLELTTESLEVEERKFISGTSSNFVVAQRQEELANAQLAELTAVLNHKKATAALLHATGKLLDERHIRLQ